MEKNASLSSPPYFLFFFFLHVVNGKFIEKDPRKEKKQALLLGESSTSPDAKTSNWQRR